MPHGGPPEGESALSWRGWARTKATVKRRLDDRSLDRLQNLRYDLRQPLERMMGYPMERSRFLESHGYPLNLRKPTSFNEKVCWRKLRDRNPLFPSVADKYRMRGFVTAMLGSADAERYLVPLLFVTRDPRNIPFGELPSEYVVKMTHGSAMNLLVRQSTTVSEEEIIARCQKWMNSSYGLVYNEWAYRRVDRRVLGETLLSDGGRPPREYKLHMFDGQCRLIQVNHSAAWYDGHTLDSGDIVFQTFYTPEWTEVEAFGGHESAPEPSPPAQLDEMVELARRIAAPFDYIRVDCYLAEGRVRLGELTIYPHRGTGRFVSAARDFEVGRMWRL